MSVAEMSSRKMKMTNTTSTIAITSVSFTSSTDSRMVIARSLRTSSVTEAGNCSRIAEQHLDRVHRLHDVDARLLLDRQIDAALAVLPARRLVVFDAVVDMRHFVQAHRVAVPVGDDRRPAADARISCPLVCTTNALAVDGAGRQIRVGVLNRGGHFVDADRARASAGRRRCARHASATRTRSPAPRR